MTDYRLRFTTTLDDRWNGLEPISLGEEAPGHGTPDSYCLIEKNEQPFLRLDLYRGHTVGFQEAHIWQQRAIVGYGQYVHFVKLEEPIRQSYILDGYFGHMYFTDQYVLVASASSLSCYDEDARRLWCAEHLGIDGVVVLSIRNDVITGEGEWNPPSEHWRPFVLSLRTGQKI